MSDAEDGVAAFQALIAVRNKLAEGKSKHLKRLFDVVDKHLRHVSKLPVPASVSGDLHDDAQDLYNKAVNQAKGDSIKVRQREYKIVWRLSDGLDRVAKLLKNSPFDTLIVRESKHLLPASSLRRGVLGDIPWWVILLVFFALSKRR